MTNPRSGLLWLFLLVPTLTELFETGRFPTTLRDIVTDVGMTLVVLLLLLASRAQSKQIDSLVSERDDLTRPDELTGLPQWASFQYEVRSRLKQGGEEHFRVVFIAIQKDRSEHHGENVGLADSLIAELAARINRLCEDSGWIAYRIGFLEFALLTNEQGADGEELLISALETLRASLDSLLKPHAVVSLSSTRSRQSDTINGLVKRALFNAPQEDLPNGDRESQN
jgi:GGDEF domain-containing protein